MKLSVSCIALGFAGFLASSSSAGVLFQTGFESPTYSTGVIGGQDGWIDNGSGNTVVQGTVAKSGTQALVLRNTSGDFADKPVSAPVAGMVFTVAFDYLHSGTNTTRTQGSVAVFGNDEYGIGRISYKDGGLLINNSAGVAQPRTAAANDVWYHLVLTVDFNTLMLSGTADGQALGNPLPILPPASGPAALTQLTLVAAQTTGGTNTEHYFDNLVVSSVPEPTTAVMLGGVALAALQRRRVRRV